MKKLVFSFVLFGIAGLGGFSLWAGLAAQAEYRDAVHAFGERPGVRVLESRFERGWMRSRAETKIELYGDPGDAFKFTLEALGAEDTRARVGFRMSHEIEHGPQPLWDWVATGFRGVAVVAEVASVVEFDHESRAEFAAVIGRAPTVSAHTVVRSDGAGEMQFSAPSQILEAVTDTGSRHMAWRGMQGSLLFAPGWRSFVGTIRSPGFDAEGPALLLSAVGMEWHLDVREGDGLPLGESSWRVGSLRIEPASADEADPEPEAGAPGQGADAAEATEPDAELAGGEGDATGPDAELAPISEPSPDAEGEFFVTLRGLGIGQSSEVGEGRYSGEAWAQVQRIEVGTAVYGPGELRVALRDLDAAALRKLRRTTRRLEAQAASGDVSGETASAAVAGEMMELLPELLAQSPRFEVESLALGLPSGNLRGSGALWFDSGGGAPANLFDVLAGLAGEFDVEAPVLSVDTFFASLPEPVGAADSGAGLGDMRKRGLVIRDGGVYRTRARFRNGQITINGLPYETVFPTEPEEGDGSEPDADTLPEEPGPTMAQRLGRLVAAP